MSESYLCRSGVSGTLTSFVARRDSRPEWVALLRWVIHRRLRRPSDRHLPFLPSSVPKFHTSDIPVVSTVSTPSPSSLVASTQERSGAKENDSGCNGHERTNGSFVVGNVTLRHLSPLPRGIKGRLGTSLTENQSSDLPEVRPPEGLGVPGPVRYPGTGRLG